MPPPLTQTMYIRFSTKQLAKQQSADFWVRVLGRPYNPADTTQFIFQTLGCQDGAHDYLVLTEPLFSQLYPKLTPQEKNFVDTNMVDINNVQVQSCLNSLPHP
jgi:hypothetical protein